MVEYIMLMGMIAFLIFTVFNSDIFKEFFGPEGTFSTNFRQEIEYSYWHTHQGREFFTRPNYQSFNHPSYLGGGGTRFFTTSQPYP